MTISVLICDDSAMARKQMARTLPKEWDVEITYATNGAEGLDAIRAGKGEVVFLDLNMPVMDGYEVLQTVQQNDLPALIIVVSGDIQIKAHERVKALGALDFIQKPVSADAISNILQEYGILTLTQKDQVEDTPMIKVDMRDACQEIANVAMGRAADLLAKLLDVFVLLPIPNVNVLEVSELTMALKATEESSTVSALCQGFIGAGVAGEALLLFHDSSFQDMAKLMGVANPEDKQTEIEVLIDTGNVLIGAFLNGISEQLDMKFSQAHPVVLGRHCTVNDLIHDNSEKWHRTLAMEINYRIENHNIQCDLLLLFTEDSIPTLSYKLGYLLD
ncbi:MAG: response regulator [Shewanella sp.]|uniref:Chemotaxis signal transduction system inhibitor of MCP methylation CheC n=2 Tax=Shewanella TaxID=22 RepID=Q8EJ98_SHEON|nr:MULTISPECIES: response regulator [Shewanella]AAN53650.1 chemotaxis signal transduction system inhibitor of MCP methylation CheC [Shewanella oneidensis MR-1]MCG9963313.1 response regulator [Shewanella sp. PS-2]MDX5997495.1 response regulator [Shewanella oneidensis]MEE2026859.1 Protein-glutamate methylesterase/protein-glutamine glutaminase [Shewanella oneidensis]QKG95472.1 response regulator [Shewanella oneidensis MR-1]